MLFFDILVVDNNRFWIEENETKYFYEPCKSSSSSASTSLLLYSDFDVKKRVKKGVWSNVMVTLLKECLNKEITDLKQDRKSNFSRLRKYPELES